MKKLLLAISKGRILEEALEILGKSGIKCIESPFTSRKLIFKTNYENLEIITSESFSTNKNIQKQTLESEDFYHLVKNKIDKTKGKIKLSNQ